MTFYNISNDSFNFFCARHDFIPQACYDSFLPTLPTEMQETARSYLKEQDRKNYLLGRFLLQQYFGNGFTWERLKKNNAGKPYWEGSDWQFSLSHSSTWVGLAVTNGAPIGLDMEYIRPLSYQTFSDCFSSTEWKKILDDADSLKAFYKAWARKESLIKADGRGLAIDLQTVILEEEGGYIQDTLPTRYKSHELSFPHMGDFVAFVSLPTDEVRPLVGKADTL